MHTAPSRQLLGSSGRSVDALASSHLPPPGPGAASIAAPWARAATQETAEASISVPFDDHRTSAPLPAARSTVLRSPSSTTNRRDAAPRAAARASSAERSTARSERLLVPGGSPRGVCGSRARCPIPSSASRRRGRARTRRRSVRRVAAIRRSGSGSSRERRNSVSTIASIARGSWRALSPTGRWRWRRGRASRRRRRSRRGSRGPGGGRRPARNASRCSGEGSIRPARRSWPSRGWCARPRRAVAVARAGARARRRRRRAGRARRARRSPSRARGSRRSGRCGRGCAVRCRRAASGASPWPWTAACRARRRARRRRSRAVLLFELEAANVLLRPQARAARGVGP